MRLTHTRFLGPCALLALLAACPAQATDGLFALPPDVYAHDRLALVPTLAVPRLGADVALAERAITRDLGKTPADAQGPGAAGSQYQYVEVKGWKSPGAASALSFAVPGTGQLYSGAKTGYVFLGVEAVAVAAYVKYHGDSNGKRDQYFSYVGDPNSSSSRFSFDRLAATVSPDELARLKAIYAKDPHEFYDIVTTNDSYASGWDDPTVGGAGARSTADGFRSDVNSLLHKSRVGLIVALTNHVVSTIDALRIAHLNNVALTQNLSMKIKVHPGAHQNYGLVLTERF